MFVVCLFVIHIKHENGDFNISYKFQLNSMQIFFKMGDFNIWIFL